MPSPTSFAIHTSTVINEAGRPVVRIHIVDPDGKDGRWIQLDAAGAAKHGAEVSRLAGLCAIEEANGAELAGGQEQP